MRTVIRALCVLALVAAVPTAITAQWPNYPTPGVPKTPDGKPNLTGPTPRTADGKPDLSGLWSRKRTDVPVGGTVTVVGYLAKDGSNLANASSVTLAGGKRVFAGSSAGDGQATQ